MCTGMMGTALAGRARQVVTGTVVMVLLVGCGRLGFDPPFDDAGLDPDGDIPPGDRPDITSNVMFVTRGNLNAAFGSLAAADATCQTLAEAAGWTGTYRAWLSTTTINAIDRLAGARGWTRTDGTPFADTPADITAGRIFSNAMYQPDGSRAATNAYSVVTGTLGIGKVSSNGTCGDYTTAGFTQLGQATASSVSFTEDTTGAECDGGDRIYCFGVDRNVPVPAPVWSGTDRRAFVSSPWSPGGGLADADAHCQGDATAKGIPGTYRALLATATASAASRFTDGRPWRRLDGVPLASTAAALLAGNLREPLNLSATGQYLGRPTTVWTGASRVTEVALSNASSCNAWTSTTNGQDGAMGRPEYADIEWFFGGGFQNCSQAASLYCLEI